MKNEEKPNTETKDKTRILIVDDHPVICEGLTQIINCQSDLLVCAEAGSIGEAVKAPEVLERLLKLLRSRKLIWPLWICCLIALPQYR